MLVDKNLFWLMICVDIINNLFVKNRNRNRNRERVKTYHLRSTSMWKIIFILILDGIIHEGTQHHCGRRDGTVNLLFPSLFTTHQSTIQQTKIHSLLSVSHQKPLANPFFYKGFFFFWISFTKGFEFWFGSYLKYLNVIISYFDLTPKKLRINNE